MKKLCKKIYLLKMVLNTQVHERMLKYYIFGIGIIFHCITIVIAINNGLLSVRSERTTFCSYVASRLIHSLRICFPKSIKLWECSFGPFTSCFNMFHTFSTRFMSGNFEWSSRVFVKPEIYTSSPMNFAVMYKQHIHQANVEWITCPDQLEL